MTEKLIIRKGDVFCVEVENEYKCFFQYIARDAMQLGSFVIRAFKTRYPVTYEPIIEEIVKDEVSFYAHFEKITDYLILQLWKRKNI